MNVWQSKANYSTADTLKTDILVRTSQFFVSVSKWLRVFVSGADPEAYKTPDAEEVVLDPHHWKMSIKLTAKGPLRRASNLLSALISR